MQTSKEIQDKQMKRYWANRERELARMRKWRERVKRDVLLYYGGKCSCCGEVTLKFLCIDHINGGGNSHRRELNSSGGAQFYSWLIRNKFPDGFRVLCFNCNNAVAMYGECPHNEKED